MAEREKTSDGPNERAVDAPVAGTAPGVPDDARAAGEDVPDEPTEEEMRRAADALDATGPDER